MYRVAKVIQKFPTFRVEYNLWTRLHANMCAARLKVCFDTACTFPLAYLTSFSHKFQFKTVASLSFNQKNTDSTERATKVYVRNF